MKKIAMVTVLSFLLCCMLSACNLWINGNYSSVTPHHEDTPSDLPENMEANSYIELRDFVANMVASGTQSGIIYVPRFNEEQIIAHMDLVERYITGSDPIGSYAVGEITYDVGTNAGRQALVVNIRFAHNRSEILKLKSAMNMQQAEDLIYAALSKCEAGVVLIVDRYETRDFAQLIQNYADSNPQLCMEVPQVNVVTYPDRGFERVVEVMFSYQNDREILRSMQDMVRPFFYSAELYVRGDAEPLEKYSQLFSFLMERYNYTIETSLTPAYSLLRHGVGDSKAFATVYSAICRQSGLDCQVVTGTRNGEPWYWNAIYLDDVYYYVDLLSSNESNEFTPKVFNEMSGYVWDYSAYGEESAPNQEESSDPTEPEEENPS